MGLTRMQTASFFSLDRFWVRLVLSIALSLCVTVEASSQPPDPVAVPGLSFSDPVFPEDPSSDPADATPVAPGTVFRDRELSAVLSESGVLVEFGDERDSHDPRAFDVLWLDDEEQEQAAVRGIYGAPGRLRLTANGAAALAAPRLGDPLAWQVALYEANGERRWEYALRSHLRTEDLAVHPNGDAVVVVMSELQMKRDRDHILIFTKRGKVAELEGIGLVKAILFPDAGSEIFVVGGYGYLLFDHAEGLLWSRAGSLWPTAARQSAVSPGGEILFVVERRTSDSRRSRITGIERWSGRVLASQDLPEGTPSGPLEVSRDSVSVRVDGNLVETEWTIAKPDAHPEPEKPSFFEIRPIYDGTMNGVYLAWKSDASGEAFEVERRVDSADSTEDCDEFGTGEDEGDLWEEVPLPSGDAESLVDADVALDGRVCYRLRSVNEYGESEWVYSPWIWEIGAVHWPPVVTGSPSILHNYGIGYAASGDTQVFLHAGLDLLAAEDSKVSVIRSGVITGCSDAAPREVRIEVQTGPAATDVVNDYYVHMWDNSCKLFGTVVSSGSVLGEVDDDTPPPVSSGASHLHYEIQTAIGASSIATTLNPLSILSSGQDPHEQDVSLADTNGDSKSFQIVLASPLAAAASGAQTTDDPQSDLEACRNDPPPCATSFSALNVATGDVELVADVSDLMSSSNASPSPLRVAPYTIKAWIKQVSGGSATIGSEQEPMTSLTLVSEEISKWNRGCLVAADHAATMGNMERWPTYLSWVLTNSVNDGKSDDNNGQCQFWRTKAKKDDGLEITGSDADEAVTNSEARFPDGRYELHLEVGDLRQTVTPTPQVFFVDNFQPSIDRIGIWTSLNQALSSWTWNAGGEPVGVLVTEDAAAEGSDPTVFAGSVNFSEPVTDAALGCMREGQSGDCVLGPQPMTPVGGGPEAVEWVFSVPGATVLIPGSYSVEITAKDLAGNKLEGLLSGQVASD